MNPIICEASLAGVLRLILVILVVYTIFSFVMRYILPAVMRNYVNNIQKQFNEQHQQPHDFRETKKEGEISITYVDKDKTKSQQPADADYVDYEEIK